MIAVYSTPADGFVTLEPLCDLGHDETVAMWKAGVRPGRIAKASGYALLVLGDRPTPVRIDSLDAPAARRAAIRHSAGGEVVLLRAEALGRSTVFRRMETIRAMSESAAEGSNATHIVSSSGYLIEKGLSPADPSDARKIAERLAGQLRYAEWTKYGAAF
ncbi:MAG: hypothetical protein PHU43_11045, partial [Candidatus Bipolaricaulis sp.]|nr:hypothetical protein [Candidatus Bipolaricaulis sp.]